MRFFFRDGIRGGAFLALWVTWWLVDSECSG
jgi:hypothetical protein